MNLKDYLVSELPIQHSVQELVDNLITRNETWDRLVELQASHSTEFIKHVYNIMYQIAELSSLHYQGQYANMHSINLLVDQVSQFYNTDTKMIGNWWEWRIGVPYMYVFTRFMIGLSNKKLDDALLKFTYKFIKHGDLTYANLASACKIYFLYGINTYDAGRMNEAIKLSMPAFATVNPTKAKIAQRLQEWCIKHPKFPHPTWLFKWKEGLYEDDYSFLQHTSVPYLGTYGVEIIELLSMYSLCLLDFKKLFENTAQKWITAFKYIIVDRQVALPYCGRSINTINPTEAAYRIKKYLNYITLRLGKELDMEDGLGSFHIFQEHCARAIYSTPEWRLYISMSSPSVAEYEGFAGDNLNGENQGLGATYLYLPDDDNYRNGHYFDRVPYDSIPGTLRQPTHPQESKHPLFNYDKDTISQKEIWHRSYSSREQYGMSYISRLFGKVNKYWEIENGVIYCWGNSEKSSSCIVDNRYNADLIFITRNTFYDKANKLIYHGNGLWVNGHEICTSTNTSYFYTIEHKDLEI